MEVQKLKEKTIHLLELPDTSDIAQKRTSALHDLYNSEKIKLITHDDNHYVTLTQYYYSEKGTAHKLQNLLKQPRTFTFDCDAIYQQLRNQHEHAIHLNENQQKGILTCLQHKVTVITGGPGTGKTTLIKQLLHILDQHKITYRLAAPTGRAAKRITEGTGRQATTLHRLLEFDPGIMRFTRNEMNALGLDFLIIDEASMIDIFLAHAVLKALPHHAHVVFIGDVDQLPSVGAGHFLHDIIASEHIASVRLIEIFRQAQDSLIIRNAHRINKGEFPLSHAQGTCHDFMFIKENDPQMIPTHLKTIFKQKLLSAGIKPDESIVLTPMNRGGAGTQKLNIDLQSILNPHTTVKQIPYAGTMFKVGDRVMQTRNNYDKLVFNGDIGNITDIDLQEKILYVRYFDRIVEYDLSELDELVLAYAISIHKSQGSEYATTIILLFTQHFTLLQRNLLYTAITRAKKLCILIGQPKAIAIAINNTSGSERKTFLREFLTTDLQCR